MSAPSWAVRGRKVVCIDDNWADTPLTRLPMLNEIATIEQVEDHGGKCPGHLILVELPAECILPPFIFCRGSWLADHFRPLIENESSIEDDVALFKKIADDAHGDASLEFLAEMLNESWVGQ